MKESKAIFSSVYSEEPLAEMLRVIPQNIVRIKAERLEFGRIY